MNGYTAELIQNQLSQVAYLDNPAAGAGFSSTYALSEFWMPRSLCFQLVTSSAVATRIVSLDIIDGAGRKMGRFSSGFTQTASLTTVYTFATDISVYGANAAASIGAPIPELWLHPGCKLQVNIAAVDTGDQVSAINLVVDQVFAGSYPDE